MKNNFRERFNNVHLAYAFFLFIQIERKEQKKIAPEVDNLLLFNMLRHRPLSLVMEKVI